MGILKRGLKPASSCKELHYSLSWPCSATGFHPVCPTPPQYRYHLCRRYPTCQRQQSSFVRSNTTVSALIVGMSIVTCQRNLITMTGYVKLDVTNLKEKEKKKDIRRICGMNVVETLISTQSRNIITLLLYYKISINMYLIGNKLE